MTQDRNLIDLFYDWLGGRPTESDYANAVDVLLKLVPRAALADWLSTVEA